MYNKQQVAIEHALQNNWELAVEANLEILDESPDNIAALNRLARAYTELDQKDAAKTVYQKVLEIDKYNPIALKNSKLLQWHKVSTEEITLSKEDFIEELGVTKTTQLIKVADRKTLLSLVCKESLQLAPRGRLLGLSTTTKVYVGCLPDDLSLKLKSLMDKGYAYSACIKNVTDSTASIFLREIKRPAKASAVATFSKAMIVTPKKKKKSK